MNSIIVHGGFATSEQAQQARERLLHAGFGSGEVSAFITEGRAANATHGNPYLTGASIAGQPLMSDAPPRVISDGEAEADHAGEGAAGGAVGGTVVGLAVGLASAPFLGPLAPVAASAVGAYVGSLVGVLSQLNDPAAESEQGKQPESTTENATQNHWHWRVAVATPTSVQEIAAIDLLRNCGALDLYEGRGQIVAGTWIDFDAHDLNHPLDPSTIAALRERSELVA